MAPIQGKIYLCTSCDRYILCMTCFSNNTHHHHSFQFKEKPTQRWRPAIRSFSSSLTPQTVSDLQNRELNENDYDILLQLDTPQGARIGCLSEKEIACLKTVMLKKTSSLLKRQGDECPVCLSGYGISQHVVELPCTHKLHKICAENWFAHIHDYCPVCNETVIVSLPKRRASQTKKYKVKDPAEKEEEIVDLLLTGSGLKSGFPSTALISSPSPSSRSENSVNVPLKNIQNNANSSGMELIVSINNNSASVSSGTDSPAENKTSRTKIFPKTKPPRPVKESVGEVALFVGNENYDRNSPKDIVKQISSVHDTNIRRGRQLSRKGPRSRSQSREKVEFDVSGIGL